MTIYICEDSYEGILCGIYDAWMSRKGHEHVKLQQTGQNETMELFAEYVTVPVDDWKVQKVSDSIRQKISAAVLQNVYKASLSKENGRADRIYRFLIYGFHYGKQVMDMLQIPAVSEMFSMCRNLDRETHLMMEFVRFIETESGFLVSRISPENDVLVLLAPHFSDRLPEENWVLLDETRRTAILHPAGHGWVQASLNREEWLSSFIKTEEEVHYRKLWCAFRKSIAIKDRYNPLCQRTHMPFKYRPYMTEFEKCLTDEK